MGRFARHFGAFCQLLGLFLIKKSKNESIHGHQRQGNTFNGSGIIMHGAVGRYGAVLTAKIQKLDQNSIHQQHDLCGRCSFSFLSLYIDFSSHQTHQYRHFLFFFRSQLHFIPFHDTFDSHQIIHTHLNHKTHHIGAPILVCYNI